MKVRNDFLKKVMKYGIVDTRLYRYHYKNVTEAEYQYAVIERILLEDFDDIIRFPNCSWQLVATTWDGEHFIHA